MKRYIEFVKIIGIGLFTTVVVNKNSFNIAVKNQTPSRNLTLADLSAFILEQMNSDQYLGTTVGLYN